MPKRDEGESNFGGRIILCPCGCGYLRWVAILKAKAKREGV
jgi:hypothetical protein